ncbi:MAG: hypothetical protein AAGF84_05640 [Planctomycetota bacterium]
MQDLDLILIGVAVLAGVCGVGWLIYTLQGSRSAFAQTFLWTLGLVWWSAVGVALFFFAAMFAMYMVPVFAVVMPAIAVGLVVLMARARWVGRKRRAFTALALLSQATRMNMPLPSMLRAGAAGEDNRTRRILEGLSLALEDGGRLSDGLARHVPEMDATHQGRIAAAETGGGMSEALADLRAEDLRAIRGDAGGGALGPDGPGGPWLGLAYGMVVATCVLMLSAGISLLIYPKFVEIFDDFDAAMPWATQVTFTLLSEGAPSVWSPAGMLLVLSAAALALLVGAALQVACRQGAVRPGAAAVLRGVWGSLPIVGTALRRGAWARSYEASAAAVRSGTDLPVACSAARFAAVDIGVDGAWRRLEQLTRSGLPMDQATRQAGLTRFDRGVLLDAPGVGDLADALAFLATCHSAAAERAIVFWRSVALPTVIIALSLLVGWLCYAMFVPLAVLIEAVMPNWSVG